MYNQMAMSTGQKKISQMPYNAGKNDPIKQVPKMLGTHRSMGQTMYLTGSNQMGQGVMKNRSGSQYKTDLKDLNSKEHY